MKNTKIAHTDLNVACLSENHGNILKNISAQNPSSIFLIFIYKIQETKDEVVGFTRDPICKSSDPMWGLGTPAVGYILT